MQLQLAEQNSTVFDALSKTFSPDRRVGVVQGDLFSLDLEGIILSPGNSYGFMDGGFDRHLSDFLGPAFESELRSRIAGRAEGLLPIGAAIPLSTGHDRFPYVVYAPTMVTPESADAMTVKRAFSAALRVAEASFPEPMTLVSPGFGSGVGQLEAEAAASAMFSAWSRRNPRPLDLQ